MFRDVLFKLLQSAPNSFKFDLKLLPTTLNIEPKSSANNCTTWFKNHVYQPHVIFLDVPDLYNRSVSRPLFFLCLSDCFKGKKLLFEHSTGTSTSPVFASLLGFTKGGILPENWVGVCALFPNPLLYL